MPVFTNAQHFCELFGLIPTVPAVEQFCDLADLAAVLYRFYPGKYQIFDIARALMAELKYSPLVFYSRMKRALAPIFAADPETLAAMGLPMQSRVLTVPDLAHRIATVCSHYVPDSDAAIAADIAQRVDFVRCRDK